MVKTVERTFGWEVISFKNNLGQLHNTRGPALRINYGNGVWEYTWYTSGLKHRTGGPAEEYSDGREWWYFKGQLHRHNGKAVIYPEGMLCTLPSYWLYGKSYTEYEFKNNDEVLALQLKESLN
uniref:Uncharacterized protein n=1 Tax=viral metagenome TaxID=1070528 RepID=A0A6C0K9C2_9ZZZZ